jgi:glycosyltransferase involved in cell wall biosynthesis
MTVTPSLHLVVPGPLNTCTGGFIYDRRIVQGLTRDGWQVSVHELDTSFPFPDERARRNAAERLAAIPDGAVVIVDGLALGALPDEARQASVRLQLIALVHHPLALETGLSVDQEHALAEGERRALAATRHVLVTSRATAETLTGSYGVEPANLSVVEPGTDRGPVAAGSDGGAVELLSVASLTPRKGHTILVSALSRLKHLEWHLVCAGSLERHPETTAAVREVIRRERLGARIELVGEVEGPRLNAVYGRADAFVLATLLEGYGMAVAEALAHGLPVIASRTGGITDLIAAGAGILVPAGSVDALTAALADVISDSGRRQVLARGARQVRRRLRSWDEASAAIANVIKRVTTGG